ncbi:IS3 family transposase [Paenibacillus lautus]|uniref:IS3 family transposase n=1 Tax=Paenibacillus lautus TaxID=1401 RepID=UPI001C7CC606|nr:IS3 family transposase [Paenibacillus lautus]MBX4150677.1 IS3 family transposase [Paenibacillus lautus]
MQRPNDSSASFYKRYEGKYGYRQLQLFLWQDDGVWMNHKKVLRLMQKLGIQASIRRNRRFKMTYQAAERVAENLLKRAFAAEKTKPEIGDGCDPIPCGRALDLSFGGERLILITRLWPTNSANVMTTNWFSKRSPKGLPNKKT